MEISQTAHQKKNQSIYKLHKQLFKWFYIGLW